MIGQGAQGSVFLIEKEVNKEMMAVKRINMISVTSGVDQTVIKELRKEVEVMKKLKNKHIIKFMGAELIDSDFCLFMEYMNKGSLKHFYEEHGCLLEDQLKQFTFQILKGLVYLHENNVIHCDLKCANILIQEEENGRKNLKLSDFGCSKHFTSEVSALTMSNVVRGSLAWMAPEYLRGEKYSRKGDIYSLGACLVEMTVAGDPW